MDTGQASKWRIASIVGAYFVVSISLVFLNKSLMSSAFSIPAPFCVTWFQCLVTVLICYVTGQWGSVSPKGSFWRQFPVYEFDLAVAAKTLRLAVVFVGMVSFNNLCLKFVEVSFYNVARSLTIVFNVVFTYALLGDTTSLRTCTTLVIVVLGFMLGTDGEVNFSLVGTLFGVAASACVSLNSIMTKSTLDMVAGNKFQLTSYMNTLALVLFLPVIVVTGELAVVVEHVDLLVSPTFWAMMWLSGAFGFAIGIVSVMQIQATSPLTHNISGTAKACVQTVMALAVYGNPTTSQNLVGIAMVLLGSLAYAAVRSREMDAQAVNPGGHEPHKASH